MTTPKKTAKKTTHKKAKAKTKKVAAVASATAQSAPALGLTEADLNDRETRVLAFLRKTDAPQTAGAIAAHVFNYKRPATTAKSWARNCLRRLVREGFVRQVGGAKAASGLRMPGEGTYKATHKGVAKGGKSKTGEEAASGDVAAE